AATKEAFPVLRYRTRDRTRLVRERCDCGRTMARIVKILGRTDDMLIVRGVNVFPSQIEHALLGVEGVAPQYQIVLTTRADRQDELRVRIEAAAGHGAEAADRAALGTNIAVAFPRSPLVHAQIAWDLQAASRGRFILGLGTQVKGHNERRYSTPWTAPGPRLREMVQLIRHIWDVWQHGAKPGFQGKYYQFSLMTPFFSPAPLEWPPIPIYIAGVNPYMCRL